MSVWLVAAPNESSRSAETTFLELKAETASTRNDLAGTASTSLSLQHSTDNLHDRMLQNGLAIRFTSWYIGLSHGM